MKKPKYRPFAEGLVNSILPYCEDATILPTITLEEALKNI